MASHPANAKYPDTVAVTYDETNHKVTCVYSDRSLYLWDVRDIRKVSSLSSPSPSSSSSSFYSPLAPFPIDGRIDALVLSLGRRRT